MRNCGDEVHELVHDGCPVACLGDAPFAYVNIFTAHVNVSFFQGATLPDPANLLQGTGKCMRHVKLIPGTPVDGAALTHLIQTAYATSKPAWKTAGKGLAALSPRPCPPWSVILEGHPLLPLPLLLPG